MLIYIRHGDDRGDDDHRHDRHLRGRAKRDASKLARRLIEKHGHPSIIYVSPFRRTLETLDAMSERFERPVMVHRDPRLAQHFSEKQQLRGPDVSQETAISKVPILESCDAFDRRMDAHVQDIRSQRSGNVIWGITHTVVIKQIAKRFDVRASKLDFLDCLVIDA